MSPIGEGRSLLLVHAHPDDESIFTGGTMARYVAEGVRVALVTCTMGERGGIRESYPDADIRDLVPENEESRLALLAKLRAAEIEAALTKLGVTEHWYLGGPGRWRDSGARRDDDSRAFRRADLDEAAGELVAVIRQVQPQVIVTYDENGFFGCPDHVQAHRVAWRAYQMACDPLRTKFYALTIPRSVLAEAISQVPPQPQSGAPSRHPSTAVLRFGVSDEQVTTEIDAGAYLNAKLAALKAHATQIMVDGPVFEVDGLVRMRALGTEHYTLLSGPGITSSSSPGQGREEDLFCGV